VTSNPDPPQVLSFSRAATIPAGVTLSASFSFFFPAVVAKVGEGAVCPRVFRWSFQMGIDRVDFWKHLHHRPSKYSGVGPRFFFAGECPSQRRSGWPLLPVVLQVRNRPP